MKDPNHGSEGSMVLSHWPRTLPHHRPWIAGNGRSEHRPCSRDGGVHHIALSGTPGSASPWNKASCPQRGRSGGSRPCLTENTTTNTSLILNNINSKKEIRKLYKENSSNEKAKTELFPKDSILELNTKQVGQLSQLSNHYLYDSVR
jgi:hypothetical protein